MYFYHFSDEKLDIDSIVEKIVVSSIYGKDAKVNMKPFFSQEALEKELDLIEIVAGNFRHKKLIYTKIRNVLKGMKEIRGTLKRLAEGSILSEIELFELKKFVLNIRLLCQITDTIKTLPDELLPERLTSVECLLDPKDDCIPTYHIYNEYSQDLKALREKIEKIENELIQDKKIQINELAIEYGLKIRPNGEFRISKSSGAIERVRRENHFKYVSEEYGLYIYQVDFDHSHQSELKLLSEYHLLEQQEEERIKKHLSHELKKYISTFELNIDRISHLDLIIGKVAFAIGYNLVRPIISDDNEIEILHGVNIPVSDRLKRDGMTYTPIDIKVRKGTSIITGSNMGGKTVTLKLIGQISAMAQLGLFVPAKKAKISLRDYIYISVGDHQSIDLGLSSFASEMVTLSEIIDQSHLNGLILVDELSRGTNPQEGYAISRSITDYLNEQESICVFTSHFDGITQGKVHFQVRGLKNLNFESLSSGYSVIETLHQQMDYTLEKVNDYKQVPKEAIPISEILGLNEWIINRAKQYLIHEKEGKKDEE